MENFVPFQISIAIDGDNLKLCDPIITLSLCKNDNLKLYDLIITASSCKTLFCKFKIIAQLLLDHTVSNCCHQQQWQFKKMQNFALKLHR